MKSTRHKKTSLFCRIFAVVSILTGLPLSSPAETEGDSSGRSVKIRVLPHDLSGISDQLYCMDPSGALAPIKPRRGKLSQSYAAQVTGGAIRFYSSQDYDKTKPEEHLMVSMRIPETSDALIILLFPSRQSEDPSDAVEYKLIDETQARFPGGESRVINLSDKRIRVKAGEHQLAVEPDDVGRIPKVEASNEYKMAQTNFYLHHEGTFMAISERQVRYSERIRRIYIVSDRSKSGRLNLKTVVDPVVP